MLTIKKVGSESIPTIQQLVQIIWPATYDAILPPGQSAYMLNHIYSSNALQQQMQEGQQFIITYADDIPIAFASYAVMDNLKERYKIHKIYLLPNQQGKGIGRLLVKFIMTEMRSGNLLQLNVNRFNPALNFYLKIGFRNIESIDIPIGERFFMEDYILELVV